MEEQKKHDPVNRQQLQALKERFLAFLNGETQIVADEAFCNAVNDFDVDDVLIGKMCHSEPSRVMSYPLHLALRRCLALDDLYKQIHEETQGAYIVWINQRTKNHPNLFAYNQPSYDSNRGSKGGEHRVSSATDKPLECSEKALAEILTSLLSSMKLLRSSWAKQLPGVNWDSTEGTSTGLRQGLLRQSKFPRHERKHFVKHH
ncbi:Calcium-dependent secretion activator 1 [Liparis tanakae]|uniref:Calcium-dependent secretion activator 1 n=1 Tax=Liparis tanakae TaxID=230148 RepID=A0A4Z2GS57_9TELE|nr:Calcium-dependent secretion activator 1 [Liparis tanakae]